MSAQAPVGPYRPGCRPVHRCWLESASSRWAPGHDRRTRRRKGSPGIRVAGRRHPRSTAGRNTAATTTSRSASSRASSASTSTPTATSRERPRSPRLRLLMARCRRPGYRRHARRRPASGLFMAPDRNYLSKLTDPGTGTSGIEVIQFSHRYVVAWPSIHRGQDVPLDRPRWQRGRHPQPRRAAQATACMGRPPGRHVLVREVADHPRRHGRCRGGCARRGDGGARQWRRHDGVHGPVLALVGFANRGSKAAERALRTIYDAFIPAVTAPGDHQRSLRDAEDEWDRMTTRGKAAAAGVGEAPGTVMHRRARLHHRPRRATG